MNVLDPCRRETSKEAFANQFVYCSIIKHLSNDQIFFSLTHSCSLTCGSLAATVTTGSPSLEKKLSKRATSGELSCIMTHSSFWNFPYSRFTSIGPGGRIGAFKTLVKWMVGFPQVYGASCASSRGQWLLVLLVLAQHF